MTRIRSTNNRACRKHRASILAEVYTFDMKRYERLHAAGALHKRFFPTPKNPRAYYAKRRGR